MVCGVLIVVLVNVLVWLIVFSVLSVLKGSFMMSFVMIRVLGGVVLLSNVEFNFVYNGLLFDVLRYVCMCVDGWVVVVFV